jgi:hypothetical protein
MNTCAGTRVLVGAGAGFFGQLASSGTTLERSPVASMMQAGQGLAQGAAPPPAALVAAAQAEGKKAEVEHVKAKHSSKVKRALIGGAIGLAVGGGAGALVFAGHRLLAAIVGAVILGSGGAAVAYATGGES